MQDKSFTQQSQQTQSQSRKRYLQSNQSPSTLTSTTTQSRNPSSGGGKLFSNTVDTIKSNQHQSSVTSFSNISPYSNKIPLKQITTVPHTQRSLTPESISNSSNTNNHNRDIDPAQIQIFTTGQVNQFKLSARQSTSSNHTAVSRNSTSIDILNQSKTFNKHSNSISFINNNGLNTSSSSQLPHVLKKEDDNIVGSLRSKYKLLKEENKKLKGLLKQSETIIVNKVCEGKQEQQQALLLYNAIYPIIQQILGGKQQTVLEHQANPPSNFHALIQQLDELKKQVHSSQFTHMLKEQKSNQMESNIVKQENDFLKGEVKRLQAYSLRLEQTLKTNDTEYQMRLRYLVGQLKELRAFKASVNQHVQSDIALQKLRSIKFSKEHQLQHEIEQHESLLPSFLRVSATETFIDENTQAIIEKTPQQKQRPVVGTGIPLMERSKTMNQTSIADISSTDLGPLQKQQLQIVNMNRLKGLQTYQQNGQEHQVQQSKRRQEDLGGGSNGGAITARQSDNFTPDVKQKENVRKASFSPSIFVRRYLPFFK